MIVFKQKSNPMLDRLTQKLDQAGIEEYEIVEDIPEKSISISSDLVDTKIYLPDRYGYSQYDIDDFVRSLGAGLRTSSSQDRDMIVLKVRGRLTETQYFKLIKYIIEEEEYCAIVD